MSANGARKCALAAALLAIGAAPAGAERASGATPVLTRVVLRAAQVGPGYRLQQRPDGHGVRGLVTLDLCGFSFPSERLRTDRLQVNYVPPHEGVRLSNEVVTYRPGGARQALAEVAHAAAHCPRTPVESTIRGVGPLTYRIKRIADRRLLPGSVALRVHLSGTINGRHVAMTSLAVYEARKDVLSGLYTYGRRFSDQLPIGMHAAAQSAANLRRL